MVKLLMQFLLQMYSALQMVFFGLGAISAGTQFCKAVKLAESSFFFFFPWKCQTWEVLSVLLSEVLIAYVWNLADI